MKKLVILISIALYCIPAFSQVEFESFTDGNITASPAWGGNTTSWTVENNTLQLGVINPPAGNVYLSTAIYNWSLNQEWGVYIGRANQAATASNQSYFWLYANEADLTSATVDGYRIAYGDDLANDHIRLEYIVDGAVNSTIITSAGTTANGITYFGFLVRVKRSAAGVWELYTSTLPQVSNTGAVPTNIPNAVNTPVNQGTGTQNSIVPATNGYIGFGALYTSSGLGKHKFDQVYFTASPANTPVITVTPPAQVDSLISVIYTPSPAKPFVVQGTDLVNDIIIPANYGEVQVSLSNNPFIPTTSDITLTPVAGVVPPTTLYVRMVPMWFPLSLQFWEILPIKSTAAVTRNVNITGFVLDNEPTVQSTLSFVASTYDAIVLNVAGGDGKYQMLVAKESSPVDFVPQDTRAYIPAPNQYGVSGTAIGNGNYIVASGNLRFSNPISITGFSPGKTYHFAVYNFNVGEYSSPIFGEAYYSQNYLLTSSTGIDSTLKIGAPLPILINYITGTRQTGKNLLNWKVTCISTPRVTMLLERSADSRNFTGINSITADAVRCNQPFNYVDADPLPGMNYYRLKMIDADGKISYSSIVALLNAVKGFDIISIAPNPVVNDNLNLNVASAQACKMEIVIFDMQGRLVNRQALSVIAGFNSLPVNVSNLSAGTYTISGSMADDKTRMIRFVKQ